VIITIAVVVTIVVVVFARDIQHQAHRSNAERTSLNRNFRALSDSIINDENAWGAAASQVVATGANMTRSQLATNLDQLRRGGTQLDQRVSLLESPSLAHDVQATLIAVTRQRVSAIDHLIGAISAPLQLPHAGPASSPDAVAHAIGRSNDLWKVARFSLVREPGRVVLSASSLSLATDPLAAEVAALVAAPSLAPVRSLTIAAVSVSPAPLPAPAGIIHLVPTSSLVVGVTARNGEYVDQPLTITVVVRPVNGVGRYESRSFQAVAGPNASVATVMAAIPVSPSERADLVVRVVGAGAPGDIRHYSLVIAPSPTH
jgi:hypothetical protein